MPTIKTQPREGIGSLIEQLLASGVLGGNTAPQTVPGAVPQPVEAPAPAAAPEIAPSSALERIMQDFPPNTPPQDPNTPPQDPNTPPQAATTQGAASPESIGGLMSLAESDATKPDRNQGRGLFGRIRQQPGGAQALIALGANLLSAPNFFEGLGRGATAYQAALDAETARLRPTSELAADGAFVSRYDPATGKRSFERTPIADYEDGQLNSRLANQALIARDRNDNQYNIADLRERGNTARAQLSAETDLRVAQMNNENDLEVERLRQEGDARQAELESSLDGQGNPPPASVLRLTSDHRRNITEATRSIGRINSTITLLDSGSLDLDIASRTLYNAQLLAGISSPEANRYAELKSLTQNMANAILMANRGVQTDGDAARALMEVSQGGDATTVRQALLQGRAALEGIRRDAMDGLADVESNYGLSARPTAASRPAPRASAPRTQGRTSTGVSWRVVN